MTRKIDVSLISANNIANSYVVSTLGGVSTYRPIDDVRALPTVINDISSQFSGLKTIFPIRVEQDYINTIADSKNIQVTVNGQILAPYVKQQTWPWFVEYDSFKGFRVRGSNVTIYNAPDSGDQAIIMITSNNSSVQTRKYPFSATTIALGD